MSHRTAAWLAWSLCAVCAALIALALLLDFATTHQSPFFLPGRTLSSSLAVLAGLLSMAYPTVGALIASRLPTNPIGWLFCGVGLIYAVRRLTVAYADYVLNENIALPWGQYVAWFSLLVWFAVLILVGAFLMLLFPDGRLPSRRWRIVGWAAVFGAALTTLADALRPGPLPNHPYIDNPFGVWITIGGFTTSNLYAALSLLGMTLLTASTLAALISLILRLHRARGDQRQQLKWFLYAVVPSVVFTDLLLVHGMLDTLTTYFVLGTVFLLSWVAIEISVIVAVSALLIVPVFTYIAILRYRLYDIDVVINRTLVYGTLTVLLALVYFGGIVVLQRLFVALTGQKSTLAVVASTLVIAALFNPLRHRIQAFVDRRFYRKKYDARKTLEAFSAKLRDETNLDALSDDLVGVVRETMQPAHVSLWLRPDTARKSKARVPRD